MHRLADFRVSVGVHVAKHLGDAAEALGTALVEWYKVHDEPERLEHSISEDVEQKLIERPGPDAACPHGNQINKSSSERRKLGLLLLWESSPSSAVRVNNFYERDRKLLEYFDGLCMRPGVELEVLSRNHDGTLNLRLKNTTLTQDRSRCPPAFACPRDPDNRICFQDHNSVAETRSKAQEDPQSDYRTDICQQRRTQNDGHRSDYVQRRI